MNDKTIEYYNTHAAEFAAGTENADMSECRNRFLQYLQPGQRILDAGCGSGRDMLAFLEAGFKVDGFDASSELCAIASRKTGLPVKQRRFEELEGEEEYDGIWACASLLHVVRTDLPDVLHRLYKLLKPGGFLYASFKYGDGERVKEGRYFCDFTQESCRLLTEQAGFKVKEIFLTGDVREGRGKEMWVNVMAEKSTPEVRDLNWAVLGTGVIANEMATCLGKMGRPLYAVGNRTYSKGVAFAKKYGIEKVYDTIDEMFTDDNVDIIYITSPHNTHYGFMKKALENGKHLLVEKSITLNSQELDEMISLAKSKNLILAEAMTIWHMPIYKELWRIVESGELGRVQMITVNFGSFKEYNMENRFFNRSLAGGAMLDIGVYALSIVRSFMEEKPARVVSQWRPAPTGVDEQATILLQNSKGQMATVALSLHSKQPKRAMISCEKGYIEIMEYPRADKAVIIDAATGARREIAAGELANALYYELADMENAVRTGDAQLMKLGYSKDVMDIMTALRNDWGLVYPEEETGFVRS